MWVPRDSSAKNWLLPARVYRCNCIYIKCICDLIDWVLLKVEFYIFSQSVWHAKWWVLWQVKMLLYWCGNNVNALRLIFSYTKNRVYSSHLTWHAVWYKPEGFPKLIPIWTRACHLGKKKRKSAGFSHLCESLCKYQVLQLLTYETSVISSTLWACTKPRLIFSHCLLRGAQKPHHF